MAALVSSLSQSLICPETERLPNRLFPDIGVLTKALILRSSGTESLRSIFSAAIDVLREFFRARLPLTRVLDLLRCTRFRGSPK